MRIHARHSVLSSVRRIKLIAEEMVERPKLARVAATSTSDVTDRDFQKVYQDVRTHIDVGLQLYMYSARRKSTDARFHDLFVLLDSLVNTVGEHQKTLSDGAPSFDFIHDDGKRVEANGFRSLLYILNCCMLKLRKYLARNRTGVFYIPGDDLSSITAYTRALEGIEHLLKHAVMLMESGLSSRELFNDDDASVTIKRFLSSEYINRDVYYGRCLGFQFPATLRHVLKLIAIGMASYEVWYRGSDRDPVRKFLQSLRKGNKYLNAPGQLGVKLDDLTQDCSVHYVKSYWSILEQGTVKAVMNIVSQSVEVSSHLLVPAKKISIKGSKGIVELTPPYSSIGFKRIPLLLTSYRRRVGQSRRPPSQTKQKEHALSPGLVVHVHGGGFVTHSPKMYLRKWARELDTPIVSIDYTLALEDAFPRAVEEIVFAFSWILQNSKQLGSTAEQVVLVGTSTGGNFIIAAAMKLAQLGFRLPDSIISCYPVTILTSSISPSRFLSLMDILLPIGVLISYQKAYCGCVPEDGELQTRKEARKKLLKATGVIIPEPGSKPPVTMREFQHGAITIRKRSIFHHHSREVGVNESLEETSALLDVDMEEQTDGVFDDEDDPSTSLLLREGEEGMEVEQGGTARFKHHNPCQHPLTSYYFHRHELDDEADKLSPAKKEHMISEVLKSYESPDISTDPLMSIALAPLDMLQGLPPIHIVGAMLDPLLDDAVVLAKRLQAARQPVTLDIFPDLPHGFLSIVSAGNEPQLTAAHSTCLGYLKRGLGLE